MRTMLAEGPKSPLAEREREGLHALPEKLDFKLPIGDGLLLPDQLVQPLFGHNAVAVLVDVNSVSRTRRPPVDQHTKFQRTFQASPGP